MKTLRDLQVGDEIQGYMRQSLSLEVGRFKDGTPYRFVPKKPQRASAAALSRFQGTLVSNDTVIGILKVNTVSFNSLGRPRSNDTGMVAEISYTAFDRVFLLSAISFEPRDDIRRGGIMFRPTAAKGLGAAFKAFRTRELIHIPQT